MITCRCSDSYYVFRCRIGREIAAVTAGGHRRPGACDELAALGLEVICPTRRVAMRRKRGRRRIRDIALWPGYVIAGGAAIDWLAVGTLARDPKRAVRGALAVGGAVVRLSAGVVADLRQRDWSTVALPRLRPNQRVRITKGPFTDIEAEIESLDDDRAWVLLAALGSRVRVSLMVEDLEAA